MKFGNIQSPDWTYTQLRENWIRALTSEIRRGGGDPQDELDEKNWKEKVFDFMESVLPTPSTSPLICGQWSLLGIKRIQSKQQTNQIFV